MIWLFRYLKGYLIVKICGKHAEHILNIAAKNRILLWNLRYKKGSIIGCIGISDFYKLRFFKRKLNTKIKIIKKCGLPFKTARFKKRAGLFVGAVIFIVVLKLLSCFIWCVEVEGNKTIPKTDIIKACQKIGIREGNFSKNIAPSESAQKLLLSVPELAWASVNIEGCRATVNVTESKDIGEDTSIATNIKAGFDGEIKKIDVTSGTVCVKLGDIVKAGDLLVSGVNSGGENGLFAHSSGTITAKTRRVFTSQGNFSQSKIVKNGKVNKKRVLTIFSFDIPLYLGEEKSLYVCKSEKKNLKIFGREMPVSVTEKRFEYCDKISVNYSEDQLTEILKQENISKIKESGITDYTVLEENTVVTENGIVIETVIETVENIAVQEIIIVNR